MPEEIKMGGMTFADEPDLIKDGEYEVNLENVEKKVSQSGVEYIDLKFRIRSDVDQGSHNRVVFDRIFKDKGNADWYDLNKLKALVVTQSTGRGWSQNFATCDDCIQYLIGLNMRVYIETINNEKTNFDDKTQIKYLSYKKSNAVTVAGPSTIPTVSDPNDLPF